METNSHCIGIDWGDSKHTVAVFEPATEACRVFTAPHTAEGLKNLLAALPAASTVLGVAVEGEPELLVALLSQAGYVVYAINPKLSKCWREAHSVAGAKDDTRDAVQLARQLRYQHSELRPLRLGSQPLRNLTTLCELEETLIQQQTGLIQQLEATLKQYYPAALEFFDDWGSPAAWEFVVKYSTPDALAKTTKNTLRRFLAARRIGMSPVWQRRVERAADAANWPKTSAQAAFALMAQCLARQLQTLHANLRQFRKQIEAEFDPLPDAELFRSLPGAGPKLAPRLYVMFGEERAAYASAQPLQKLGGVAPVTKQSGRKRTQHIRRACKKHWRNTLRHFAHTSKFSCDWARAFYRQRRDQGDTESTALRKLSFKWLKIIYRMWQERKPYDNARYLKSLKKQNSRLLMYIGSKNTVDKPVENVA